MAALGIRKALRATYDEALTRVPEALKSANNPKLGKLADVVKAKLARAIAKLE